VCIAIDDGPARWDFWHTEIVHIPTLQHLPHYYTAQLFQAVSNCNLGLLHQTYITPCLTPLLECTHIWCRRLLRSRRAWRFAIFPILLLVIFLLSNFLVGNPPPPRGVFLFCWFPNDVPGGRGPVLSQKTVHLKTTQKGNPPGGWRFRPINLITLFLLDYCRALLYRQSNALQSLLYRHRALLYVLYDQLRRCLRSSGTAISTLWRICVCVWASCVCQTQLVNELWTHNLSSDKMISLFCRISSLLYGSFAKETYNFYTHTHTQFTDTIRGSANCVRVSVSC